MNPGKACSCYMSYRFLKADEVLKRECSALSVLFKGTPFRGCIPTLSVSPLEKCRRLLYNNLHKRHFLFLDQILTLPALHWRQQKSCFQGIITQGVKGNE